MRRLNDHILVVSADWENPAPEIPVFEWKCEFTEEGGRWRERDRKWYSNFQTRSNAMCSTAFSVMSGKHT